jgi:cytidylate kinase
MKKFVIAIDGVAASGKGTLAGKLAEHYHANFLPTGNIYRHVAKQMLDCKIAHDDELQIKRIAHNIHVKDLYSPELMKSEISAEASQIAKLNFVREELNRFQRKWIERQTGVVIVEGRDIGTVICPSADLKLFLTASMKERARRRLKDLIALGVKSNFKQVYDSIKARDINDKTRNLAPLKKASDAITINSSKLTIKEMLSCAIKLVDRRVQNL